MVARILIAEDDPLIGSFLEKGLRASGFSTFLTDDGEQAQRLALTEEFDLMLLDMGLPKLEGFQVLQELRRRGNNIPVLELTAREFSLLETFMRHPGQVLTREQILSHVWGYFFDPQTNLVNVYVGALRKKLGDGTIETVRGAGYRLRTRDR